MFQVASILSTGSNGNSFAKTVIFLRISGFLNAQAVANSHGIGARQQGHHYLMPVISPEYLSGDLHEMESEGLIEIDKREIRIFDVQRLTHAHWDRSRIRALKLIQIAGQRNPGAGAPVTAWKPWFSQGNMIHLK